MEDDLQSAGLSRERGAFSVCHVSRRKRRGGGGGEEGEREDSLWQLPTKIGFALCKRP